MPGDMQPNPTLKWASDRHARISIIFNPAAMDLAARIILQRAGFATD